MRLITRNDTSLVVGLIAGTIVVFQRPLRIVWDVAVDIQQRYNVDLVPALSIFLGVFIFHETRKRHQAKADAVIAAAEAEQARKRSAELADYHRDVIATAGRRLMWAGAGCDVLFVVAFFLMIYKPA